MFTRGWLPGKRAPSKRTGQSGGSEQSTSASLPQNPLSSNSGPGAADGMDGDSSDAWSRKMDCWSGLLGFHMISWENIGKSMEIHYQWRVFFGWDFSENCNSLDDFFHDVPGNVPFLMVFFSIFYGFLTAVCWICCLHVLSGSENPRMQIRSQ